jgi:hypothetical protein
VNSFTGCLYFDGYGWAPTYLQKVQSFANRFLMIEVGARALVFLFQDVCRLTLRLIHRKIESYAKN